MIILHFLILNNPFVQAYSLSDLLGKCIFLGLFSLSIISWILMIYKWKLIKKCNQNNIFFYQVFKQHKNRPLEVPLKKDDETNPFMALYLVLKGQTIELLAKNNQFIKDPSLGMLSSTDIDSVATLLVQERRKESEKLEKNIYILSMVTTLGPFLGLLGTVWGILMTFSNMQGGSSSMVLAGISLALATTVVGLIDAIPALIGYHVLKQKVRKIDFEMESFTADILAAVELTYRKVDV